MTSIGSNAFSGCSGLQKVIVPDIAAWCEIGFGSNTANPLYYAHRLYSDEVTEIKNLIIPNSVTSIGSYAFSGCSSLTSITIPNSVTSIGSSAFSGCFFLYDAFVNNSTLTSVNNWEATLCDEETSEGLLIKDNVVVRCRPTISSVTIPNSVTRIGSYAFQGCSSLTSVTIPNSVTSIGSYAFSGCRSLTSVTIPNSVTSIGEYAFSGCSSLTSVTIGSGVKSIGEAAFSGCRSLTDVYCYAENVPNTSSIVFNNSSIASATLHVPAGSVEAYKANWTWSGFGSIVAIE